jgi:phosphoribosyl 1,2-cyclic phosphodiesterase
VRLRFCGTRGSTPAPGAEFSRYGGHTSCVAISHDGDAVPTLILDAGTGLREVTALLGGRPFDGAILLSHLHWDHVHGLPFFRGGDTDGATVSLLLPDQGDGVSAEAVLERGMSPPHFPIRPRDLRGDWTFGVVGETSFAVAGFRVEAREVPHKGGRTFGYRVSDGQSVVTYIPDHCPTLLGPGPDEVGEYHAAALELTRGADVLIHDAALLAAELPAQAHFGHAAAEYAVGLAKAAGAREAVLFHHGPDRTDRELDDLGERLATAPVPVTVAAQQGILSL